MKKTLLVLILALLAILPSGGAAQAQAEYRIAPGDVLSIEVWGREDFKPQVGSNAGIEVRPDGKLNFPLLGELKVEGATVSELTAVITQGLSEYIRQPQVTVNVLKFHTTRVYVLGEVNRPGVYEIAKQHNLLDAIGLAQGYTKDAAKKKIFLIRKDQTDQPVSVNLYNLLNKGDMSQNYVLGDGDVVFLTDNNRIDFARDVLPLISGLYFIKNLND